MLTGNTGSALILHCTLANSSKAIIPGVIVYIRALSGSMDTRTPLSAFPPPEIISAERYHKLKIPPVQVRRGFCTSNVPRLKDRPSSLSEVAQYRTISPSSSEFLPPLCSLMRTRTRGIGVGTCRVVDCYD